MKEGVSEAGAPSLLLFVNLEFYERSEIKFIVEQSREVEG
jgi:hypothetical protein